MDFEIGSHYVIETHTGGGLTQVFGRLSNIDNNVFGTHMTRYTFSDCIVNNEDNESFRVSRPVQIYSHAIIKHTKIEPIAEAMIYALSKKMPNALDAETVEQLVERIESMPLKQPTRAAINIEGAEHSDNEEDADADYGGGKRRRKTSKRKNNRRRRSAKKY